MDVTENLWLTFLYVNIHQVNNDTISQIILIKEVGKNYLNGSSFNKKNLRLIRYI